MDSESDDSDYHPNRRQKKGKRSNSESDVFEHKIRQRSRSDSFFKSQNKEMQLTYLSKEEEVYNYFTANKLF